MSMGTQQRSPYVTTIRYHRRPWCPVCLNELADGLGHVHRELLTCGREECLRSARAHAVYQHIHHHLDLTGVPLLSVRGIIAYCPTHIPPSDHLYIAISNLHITSDGSVHIHGHHIANGCYPNVHPYEIADCP